MGATGSKIMNAIRGIRFTRNLSNLGRVKRYHHCNICDRDRQRFRSRMEGSFGASKA